MKVILLGATGVVGQGVLRECLLDLEVESALAVGRNATGPIVFVATDRDLALAVCSALSRPFDWGRKHGKHFIRNQKIDNT